MMVPACLMAERWKTELMPMSQNGAGGEVLQRDVHSVALNVGGEVTGRWMLLPWSSMSVLACLMVDAQFLPSSFLKARLGSPMS